MSYILDALKKAEQGRNQGKAPALFAVQTVNDVSVVIQRSHWPWIWAAALILGGAILFVYWPHKNKPSLSKTITVAPFQSTQTTTVVPVSQLEPQAPVVPLMTDTSATLALPPVNAPSATEVRNEPVRKPAIEKEKTVHNSSVHEKTSRTSVAEASTSAAVNTASEPELPKRVQLPSELPPNVQQELPKLVVNMHMYSTKSANRLASVNDKPLREGDELSPGLKLMEIVPDGLVFNYKGYRFKKGIN